MFRFLLVALMLLGPIARADAGHLPPCRADKLSNANGLRLRTASGLSYQVFPGASRARVNSWLPLDRLSVCPIGGNAYEIVNLSRQNATAKVLRIYPPNPGAN